MASRSPKTPKIYLALCNAPDNAAAQTLARRLVQNNLAACVNILPSCRSVYRWRGEINDEKETPLFIKTPAEKIAALKNAVREWHPFDTPELIFIPITDGLPEYLQWVAAECES